MDKTIMAILIGAIVGFIITYISMINAGENPDWKLNLSVFATLMFSCWISVTVQFSQKKTIINSDFRL
jgi:Mg/Co/Ni transporter MgtE